MDDLPGWMPWRRFAVAQNVPAYFEQVSNWDFETLVAGHVSRTRTHADVTTQLAAGLGPQTAQAIVFLHGAELIRRTALQRNDSSQSACFGSRSKR
jgi:hypothetical protein